MSKSTPPKLAALLGLTAAVAACNVIWDVDGLVVDNDGSGGATGASGPGASGVGGGFSSGGASASGGAPATTTTASGGMGQGGAVNVSSAASSSSNTSSSVNSSSASSSSATATVSSSVMSSSSTGMMAVCGDGVIGGTEQCDGNNTANGDGCSSGCVVECPSPGFKNTGTHHCYEFFPALKNWDEAEADCVAFGGHLVAFESFGELVSVGVQVSASFYWIGAFEQNSTGYQWVNGEAFVYDNWHPAEPDPNLCALASTTTNQWFTGGCTANDLGFVCERPPPGS